MTLSPYELHRKPVTPHDRDQMKIAMRDVMNGWEGTPLTSETLPGTESAFDAMADEFRDRVKDHDAITERFRNSGAMIGGCEIFARYIYAGALTGALRGYSLDELRSMMFTQTSFTTIESLTKEHNSSAKEIEFENGLRRVTYSSVDDDPSRFDVSSDGGLIIAKYPLQRLRARLRLADEGKLDYDEVSTTPQETPTKCELNHNRTFAMCYKVMTTIALKDPLLAPATLQRPDVTRPLVVE